jgi:hypothetical protein
MEKAPESDLCHKRKVRTGAVFAGSSAKYPVHVSCSSILHLRDNIALVLRSCGLGRRVTWLTVVWLGKTTKGQDRFAKN